MEIIEGNKLIAEFMGGKFYSDTPTILEIHIVSPVTGGAIKCIDKLKYHTSWDWLMPVVEKIESIENSDEYEIDIFGNCCEIGTNDEHSAVGKTKIEAVWKAVVQFIQWYNTQPLTPVK